MDLQCSDRYSGPTLQDIRLELAVEETSEARGNQEEDDDALKSNKTTPAQFIYLLFEVEEQQ